MRAFIFAADMAAPLFAQSLDTQYEAVGDFDGVFGETPLVFSSFLDLENNRSLGQLRDASGFGSISISARIRRVDGKPTSL